LGRRRSKHPNDLRRPPIGGLRVSSLNVVCTHPETTHRESEMQLTRRNLLTGAAAIGTAALAPDALLPARAAAPPSGAQAPGFYRYKVGSFECTSINDGSRSFPMPDNFVKNVSKDQALAAAKAAYMPDGMVTVPFNPQLINTGSKLVLIDCG